MDFLCINIFSYLQFWSVICIYREIRKICNLISKKKKNALKDATYHIYLRCPNFLSFLQNIKFPVALVFTYMMDISLNLTIFGLCDCLIDISCTESVGPSPNGVSLLLVLKLRPIFRFLNRFDSLFSQPYNTSTLQLALTHFFKESEIYKSLLVL